MGDLLQQVPMLPAAKKVPLLIEIPVNGEGAPFLISGLRDWVWIKGSKSGIVRSAVRPGGIPADIFTTVTQQVAEKGASAKWGNTLPFSDEGLKKAAAYLKSYGLDQVEALVPVGSTLQAQKGVKLSESTWVSSGRAVVVPLDRTYLGLLGTFGPEYYTVVLHNPSRGMVVLGDW